MLPQKIQVVPFLNSLDPASPEPLIFWKKIRNRVHQEIHCFLQVEARSPRETEELGRELWGIVDNYLQESTSQNIFPLNAENLCEELSKMFNQFLFGWGQRVKISNFSEFNIFVGASSPHSFYFSKIGDSRVILFRSGEIIQIDEKNNEVRSPHAASPFSEVTGGNLKLGDRFMVISKSLVQFQPLEEIFSLVSPRDILGAFYNMVKSIEVIQAPINTSFLLAEVCAGETEEVDLPLENSSGRLKEYTIFDNVFQEFNSLEKLPRKMPEMTVNSSLVPYKGMAEASSAKILSLIKILLGFLTFPFRYLMERTSSLSFFRRLVLFSGLAFFIIFVFSVGYFFFNKPEQNLSPQIDYQSMLDQANKLVEDSNNSLIYKDENKARKELGEADALLQQVSQSGDLGIKALKVQKEVKSKMAVLDKASGASNISLIFNLPGEKEVLKNIGLAGDDLMLFSKNSFWSGKISGDKFEPKETEIKGENSDRTCLSPQKGSFLLIYPEIKSFYNIVLGSSDPGAEKKLSGGNDKKLSSCASYTNFLYFWSSEEKQIQQFSLNEKKEATFSRNWITSSPEELKTDDVASLAVDGGVFLATRSGLLMKLSGGKKAPFDFEKPAIPFKGENTLIKTREDQKNLYLLDRDRERIIIYDKETGKMKGQIQDKILAEAVDLEVLESKNQIYFISGKALFKMEFKVE